MIRKTDPAVWRERIDDAMWVVCARLYTCERGWVRGASTFILVDDKQMNWEWRRRGVAAFEAMVNQEHAGRLPYVGNVSSLNEVFECTT